jgi:polyisoprenoid-binding protein YceI
LHSRLFLAALAVAAIASAREAPVREFRIDAGHSDVAFSIGFLGHPVRGRFDDIRGTIVYTSGKPAASAISVVIAAKSIATGSAHRDEHLRSADFFDVARYPSIVFRSTSIESSGTALVANGILTMHGLSRAVSIPFRETSPPIADPHGSTLVLFSGQLRIARKDFGILGGSKYNDWFDEIRSATMADSVDISLDITGWDTDLDRVHTYDANVQRIEREGIAPSLERLRALRARSADSIANAAYDIEQVARSLQQRGRTAEAIALFQFSAETFDKQASTHTALARAFELAGKADSSRAHTLRALALDSLDALDQIYHWTELIQSSPLAVERSVHAAIGGAYRSQGITTLELRFNPMKRNRGGADLLCAKRVATNAQCAISIFLRYATMRIGQITCIATIGSFSPTHPRRMFSVTIGAEPWHDRWTK